MIFIWYYKAIKEHIDLAIRRRYHRPGWRMKFKSTPSVPCMNGNTCRLFIAGQNVGFCQYPGKSAVIMILQTAP
jgi:hypothetical protein